MFISIYYYYTTIVVILNIKFNKTLCILPIEL
nr:MAG TPA: hypothetical protein [Caudoviricetes sp.]